MTSLFTGGGGNEVFVGEIKTALVATKIGNLLVDVILDVSDGDRRLEASSAYAIYDSTPINASDLII